jgi:hypothetical protein
MPQGDGSGPNQPPQPSTASVPSAKTEKAIVFSRPEQISEILKEVERLQLQVLIRYSNDGRAIRGFVERANIRGENGLRISGISSAGEAVLASHEVVKVEFVLLSKKLYFVTRIRARSTGRILINAPEKLYAIERRRNARFAIPSETVAFMEFDDIEVDVTRLDAPLNPDILGNPKKAAARLKLDDISLGGTAIMTRFAAYANVLKPSGDNFLSARLFLPKTPPIAVPVGIRWFKKSTAALLPGTHEDMRQVIAMRISASNPKAGDVQFSENFLRYGIQFAEVSNELDKSLRDFIHVCQTAQSV